MTRNQATAVALLAALAWGIGNVAQKTIFDHLDGWAATGITSIVGALVLMPLAWRESEARLTTAPASWGLLAMISLFFTVASAFMQFSYGWTSVTNAGFLTNTSAVLTPILAWVCFHQRPAPAIWPASLLALLGVFLMAGARLGNLSLGDIMALLSAIGYAGWTLLVGLYVMRTRRPILMTVVQLAVCGVLCTMIGASIYGPPTMANLVAALPEILFIGIVSKGLAFMLMAVAQQHISATSIGVIVSAEAVFGAMIAAVVLGESLGFLRGAGSLCIILGVIIAARIPLAPGGSRVQKRPVQP
jgi:drug/metabolite transporter (DMT)-like permease